jgi:outer membrane protein W
MKKMNCFFILFTLCSTVAFGQMSIGGGLGLLTPMGQNSGSNQFGLNLMGRYEINDDLYMGVNIGYYQKSNNQTVLGTTFKSSVFSLPVSLTGQYLFLRDDFRPYISADLGLFTMGARFNGASSSASYLSIAPGTGARYALNKELSLDFSVRYNILFISNNTTGILATNIGLLYAF